MVADFLVVFLVDAGHLVAAASVPGRKLVDLEMSLLVAAGLEIDDLASPSSCAVLECSW
jgi:hypothetical protein